MAWFRKIKAGLVKSEITDYIGEAGHIFYNNETGELRISDGVTPFGHPIMGDAPDILISDVQQIIQDLIDNGTLAEATVEYERIITELGPGHAPGSGLTTISSPPNMKVGTQTLFLNGIRQREGADNDYTIDPTTITFVNDLELFNDDVINIIYVEQ